MSKFFKAVKAAAITALCAVGVMSLSGCENYSKMLRDKPDEYINMAMENTVESMGGNNFSEEKKLLEQALEDGSFSLGFETDGITFNGVCEVSEKLGAVSQMYTLSNADGNSAQIYVYADKDSLKLGTIGDSGSHIYDVTLESFAEKLAASIFAPDSDSAYAMSETDYNELLEYAEMLSAAVENSESQGDDKYQKLFEDFKNGHAPVIEEKTDIEIGGETVSSNVITYTIPTEDVKTFITDLFETALADENVKGQLPEYYDEETLRESFSDLMDALEECGITAAYYINAKTNVMMKSDFTMNITVDEQPIKVYVNSFFGADPASAEKQTFDAGADIAGETASFNMAKIRTDNGWLLEASADFIGGKTDLLTVEFTQDGKNYSLTFEYPGDVVAPDVYFGIDGTFEMSKTSFDMTVDKISYTDSEGDLRLIEPKAKVNVKKGGEISVLDAEKELLDLTEEEMDALLDAIGNDIGAIIDGADGSGAMGSYVKSSRLTQANANAKSVHIACTANMAQRYVDDEDLVGGAIEGSGTNFTVGGVKVDMSPYLGNEFYGYVYGCANESTFAVEYIMWSQDPIPEEYKHKLTKEEQDKLADEKIFIGCYPVPKSEGLVY